MLIIQSSHRKTGSTAAIVASLADKTEAVAINLCDHEIAHFNYDGPGIDDFESLIEVMTQHKQVVLATPIYWYTMSGMLKVFLDRISDLLKWNKDLGRKIRGVKMHVISVSGHDDAPEEFTYPFKLTADYLGMTFGHYVHICPGKEDRINDFAKNIQVEDELGLKK
jgi:multimeric flavodoxin WrbA